MSASYSKLVQTRSEWEPLLTTTTLKMHQPQFDELRFHGEESYPHECCGVLVGHGSSNDARTVLEVIRCVNMSRNSPQNRYQIDPHDLVRIQRESRLAGREIVGFYHSHPDQLARWSATDLAEAHWTGCSYVITSVEQGRANLTNSFVLRGADDARHFEDENIQVDASNV